MHGIRAKSQNSQWAFNVSLHVILLQHASEVGSENSNKNKSMPRKIQLLLSNKRTFAFSIESFGI